MRKLIILPLLILLFFSGCAINPVTGERELAIIPESQEISIGQKNYSPSRQMQGGDFKVDPVLTAYVNGVGQRLARVSDRKLPYEFVVLNNSVPNAWALPGGKIAVNRGLLVELNSEAELAAVLGHEIVHAAARHGAKGMERGLFLQGAIMAAGIASQGKNFADYVVGGAQVAAGLIHNKYGRDAEREADYYGMLYMSRAGYDPRAAIGLQETFVRLSKGRRSDWLSGLFSSHPPSQERVANNRKNGAALPPGGEIGRERFHQKIDFLKKTKQAYKDFDDGRKSLSNKDYNRALSLAEKALAVVPQEGHFHALRGDVRYLQQNYNDALINFDRAVSKNNNFFYFFLRRGMSRTKMNDKYNAKFDLESSVKLLPTATAYNELGNIESAIGNQQRAKEYYQAAASSKTQPGRQAYNSLVRMDLPQNPSAYIKARPRLNRTGYLLAEISNPTTVSVNYIVLRIMSRTGQVVTKQIRDTVPAGRSLIVGTGLGPYSSTAVLQNVRITVSQARIVQ